jgi:PAN domain
MYCDSNIPFSDFNNAPIVGVSDVYACLDQCSMSRPRCFGVAYTIANGACWLKTAGIVNSPQISSDNGTHSALVNPTSQLNVTNTDCPFNNGSPQLIDSGLNFTIHCNQDFGGGDYCPNSPIGNSTGCPFHTNSLSECMQLCSEAHPLCSGVSYNPDMIDGYANCYLKNDTSVGFKLQSGLVVHSAVVNIANLTSNCTQGASITSNGKSYNQNCNQNRPGHDLSVYHDTSLDKCLDTCATWTAGGQSCVGVVFDAYMEMGWENCYVKNATGTPLYNTTATFALLSTTQDNSSSDGGGGSSSSKAWIAGPVIGGLVAIAVIAAVVFFCLRRRRTRTGPGPEAYEKTWQPGAPQYAGNTAYSPPEVHPAPPAELADTAQPHQIGPGK